LPVKLPALVLALPIVSLSAAVMAKGECPTKDDLAGLISVVYEGDRVENFMPAPAQPFLTMSVEIFPDGFRSVYLLTHGVFLQEKGEYRDDAVVSGSTILYDYGVEDTVLPVPAPLMQARLAVNVQSRDGDDVERTDATYVWAGGPMTSFAIGTCTYNGFVMTLDMVGAGDQDGYRQELYYYLTELGIGLFVGSIESGQEDLTLPILISRSTDLVQ